MRKSWVLAASFSLASWALLGAPTAGRADSPIFTDSFESGTPCWWSSEGQNPECSSVYTTGTVPPGGGSVELPGVASVQIPSAAFDQATEVSVGVDYDSGEKDDFLEFTSMFPSSGLGPFFLVIETGSEPPVSETVEVVVELNGSPPAGHQFRLFARVLQDGGQEVVDIFQPFPAAIDLDLKTLTAQLPTALFSRGRVENDLVYRAVLMISAVPVDNQSSRAAEPTVFRTGTCGAATFACPLAGGCTSTSAFHPARTHPITGSVRPHYGTDFAAPVGTTVLAPAKGVVERSYTSTSFGETIIIRHEDGSASLIAHLSERTVKEGDPVQRGQTVGASGNTGASAGPHLHLEYVPSGPMLSSARVDPEGCLNVGPEPCCVASQGCPGETGCVCGAGCCCCPLNQACSSDWTQGCVPVGGSCRAIEKPFDPTQQTFSLLGLLGGTSNTCQ